MGDVRGIGGATRVAGVIGWPINHSLSPTIHNAAYEALGLDWTYVPLPVAPEAVETALAGVRALGLAGLNVTMPHKEAVAAGMDRLSEDAALLRAVNTVEVTSEGLIGHNTDAPGFARFLTGDAGFDAAGRSVLLFGAGGAARACALALARAGADAITVALREPVRAAALLATLAGSETSLDVVAFGDAAGTAPDLIVNATPLGAHGEHLPLPPLDRSTVAVDLLYRPAITPLQADVRASGGAAFGGLGLLLHQAALAFELWTGRPAPMDVMSAAALAAIGARG
ncbi:MAG: shikimate dehydrogenase [Actinomycetota bacterium]